jgi:hypothetical protein
MEEKEKMGEKEGGKRKEGDVMREKNDAETFWKEEQDKKQDKTQDKTITKQETEQETKQKGKQKINIEGEKIRNGLGQLILTVVELLRELMEKQAMRRIEAGALTDEQVERLGMTFMNLKKEVEKLKDHFALEDDDLNFDLGPLTMREDEWSGKASAVEILDRLLGTGVVVKGDVIVSVAEVDLLSLNLGLLIASIDKAKELYRTTSTTELQEQLRKLQEENRRLRKGTKQ